MADEAAREGRGAFPPPPPFPISPLPLTPLPPSTTPNHSSINDISSNSLINGPGLQVSILIDSSCGCGTSALISRRRPASRYSITAPEIDACCLLNCGDSTLRACQERKVKLSRLGLIVLTSLAPHCVAGLASILLALSAVGRAEATILGPDGCAEFVSRLGAFVNRRYPVVTVKEVGIDCVISRPLLLNLPDWTVEAFALSANGSVSYTYYTKLLYTFHFFFDLFVFSVVFL